MTLYPVIMAGGSGTRFWPLSRKSRPKQFLPIISNRTMIEETVERLLPLVPLKNVFTISNREQARMIKRLLPRLPRANVLVEPRGRNTAPSLIMATAWIYLKDPGAVVAALPADHLIQDAPRFLKKLEAGARAAEQHESLITFGIPPTFPSTGYGYIHYSVKNSLKAGDEQFWRVKKFKEKPGSKQARKFLAEGRHSWNSGMFLWRAEVFRRKLEQDAPDFYVYWEKILTALKAGDRPGLASIFDEIPPLSIDYALMEKAKGVLVSDGDFGWSDVGAWSSLLEIWLRDEAGNAAKGESLFLDSRNCLVYNPGKLTAVVGLKDVLVVETDDALLVCHKNDDQKVKSVIEALTRKGRKEYL
jgi:mannose-1-phosphate guanylyltransferase